MRRQHIERLLPLSYQRAVTPGGPLAALLAVMEAMHAPSEALLAHVEDLAAPCRAPDALVPFLLRWVAWDHIVAGTHAGPERAVPVGRLRDLVSRAASLAARRGTASGLADLLTTLCGVTGFVIEEPADRPFHLVVRVPPDAAGHLALIHRVVAAEKPAAATCDIVADQPGDTSQPPAHASQPLAQADSSPAQADQPPAPERGDQTQQAPEPKE